MKTTATMELIAGRWSSFHGAFSHKTYNDHHYGNALFYSIVLPDIEFYRTEASQLTANFSHLCMYSYSSVNL